MASMNGRARFFSSRAAAKVFVRLLWPRLKPMVA
ncbi:hypothetical protein PgNI_06551 [Pyricularia grisea]|uniref:Uncharacterized protein n=1 Tax=Pyricularia grisea TaxID=148305 RepID=A0A6P8B707_PYRGI|nr:hypothetical protein PgNI_06551 [Pyricularia grisea]TLD10909.1 hypothetical protein PgNI_06551 [Pyricularia grisea]